MPIYLPNRCLRGLTTCKPLSSIESDDEDQNGNPASFICMGLNDGSDVKEHCPQDRYTLCWKNSMIDERSHLDERDVVDTMSVLAQGLSAMKNNAYE